VNELAGVGVSSRGSLAGAIELPVRSFALLEPVAHPVELLAEIFVGGDGDPTFDVPRDERHEVALELAAVLDELLETSLVGVDLGERPTCGILDEPGELLLLTFSDTGRDRLGRHRRSPCKGRPVFPHRHGCSFLNVLRYHKMPILSMNPL
jgi:hypothetical protein